MAGFYHTNGSNPSNTSKKKKGFNHIGNAHTQNVLEYDGVKFGTVTNRGLQAIQNNTLDSYTPATEEEKRAIRSYTAYKTNKETKAEEEKNKNGASALLGTNDKIAGYITDKYPLAVPTNPSSPKEETKTETTEDKYLVRNYTKEPVKVKVGNTLPDFAQMHNTAFGNVKVDTAPNATDTQVVDFMSKKTQPSKPKNTILGNIGGVLLSVPYALEKAGAGALNAVEGVSDFLVASGARTIGSDMLGDVLFIPDSVSEKIRNFGGDLLESKNLGEKWSENVDKRYAVHDWTRSNVGVAFEGVGNLLPAIASEIYSASASPMGDMWLAKYIFGKSNKLATTANKVGNVANKVGKVVSPSDIIFGLGAAGQSASEGYRTSGDLSKSLDYGGASGLLEVAIERLSGGIAGTKYGKSILNYTTKSKPLSFILSTGGEAAEEMISKFVDTPLRRLTVDKDAEWADLKDYYESGKQGMYISLIMGVATYPFRNKQRKEAIKTLNIVTEELKSVAIDKNKIPSPLSENATIEDIQQRQKELQEIAKAYANQVVAETEIKEITQTNATTKTPTPTVVDSSTLNKGKADATPVATSDSVPAVTTPTETPTTIKVEETTPTTKGITSAYTNNNQKIDMKYKVVSADDLIVSNNIDGTVNPNYPQEYQPRERTRQASILQVQNIAKNVVPEKLGESANVSDGAPIVGSDNVVESGNGRTMALSLMYKTNPEGAKKYIEYIKANADKFGIDANNLPNDPVLVRERLTEVDRAEFVKQANESSLGAMSATELAKTDAERLTGNILSLLVANDDGNINTPDNKAFVGRVISEVFSKNDLNSVVGANGMLSANGLERIRNAMFYKAYNDVSLASKLSESLDNDIKNITNVLVNIAPKIVQIKNGIANGTLYDLDFSQDIVDGINYLQEAKRQDLKVRDFAKQITIGEDVSNVVKFIALFFEQKNRGAKQATLFFNHLCDTILSKDPNQIGFLNEDTKTPTKEEIVNEAINRYNNDEQGTGINYSEMFVSQRSEESRQAVDTRGIGNNIESVTEQRPVNSESNGTSEQHGYVEEETAPTGNVDTQRQGERGTEERRPANRTDEAEVGTGELSYDDFTLDKVKHTATNEDIWVIRPKERVEDFTELKEKMKSLGGYYSRFATTPNGKGGFVFKENPAHLFGETNVALDNEQTLSAETPTQKAQNTPKSSETKSGKETPTETENIATEPNLSDTEVKENANDEQRHEVLDGESGNDDAGLQSESRNADEEEGIERVSGDSGQTSGEVLPTDTVNRGRNKSDVGNDGEGTSRTDDNGDVGQEGERTDGGRSGLSRYGDVRRGTDRGNGVVPVTGELTTESETPEVIETVDKAVDKSRPSNKENFIITNDVAEELDNNYPSAKDNIEAIELLLKIESEGRPATADEKKILAKYKGWGGIDTRRIEWELQRRLNDLYDYEQRRSMQDSGTNAFFTPTKVIDAMYNGLKRMGFKGGNVLETSMGIGNFFGRMPSNLVAKSALTGVELEAYTARIAQLLYPGATVINKPFQDVVIKNGSYDLVIGNVPFGNEKLSYNGKKYSLHNYFIISSLDKVKDGGIVAVITSAGTLDNYSIDARSAIMDRADVVACYKLPAGVFSRNAKTDVQSDLLILRKRANGAKPVGDSILNVTEKDGLRLNEYFVKHPENILGTLSKGTNAWGEITTVLNNGKFDEMLTDAMAKLPKNIMNGEVELKPVNTIVTTESKPRFFEKDGKVYEDNGAGEAVEVTRNVDTVRDYIAVREAYKTMLDAYNQDLSEAEIKPLREALIKAYDNFYAKHTAISGDGKKKIGNKKCENNLFLEADSDYYLLCGLERHNKKEGKFEKSAVFEKDTLRKKKVTSVDTSSEALAVSLNETGSIDFNMMSELTGKTEKELAEELKGEIVYTPQGKYELLDIYLSGDIYAKLEEVKGKPEFKEQEEMLKTVLPTPKDASQITVKLGANYIDESYIEDFANDVFNQYITVKKNSSGNWTIVGAEQSRYGELVNSKYGCKSLNAIQLLQRILNDADIVCNKTVQQGDKKISVFDKEMTDIALGKAEDIRSAFENWIFRDSNRRNTIVDKYNRMYNAVKPLDYEHIASKLTFNSMNPTLRNRLYPHQKKGIARFLFGGNTLFAHGVGTGKTFEMIASVMEAKQMGIVNKTAMVVPNNKVVDFKKDILEAYPNAKVLVIDTANKKRQTMLGLVNSNDWDIILVARTTFTKIPVSAEMQKNFYNSQLEALEREIAEAQTDRNISKRQINSLINQRKTLEEKLKDLDKATDRDEGVDFDKLGIDCICVDEAHNYKSVTTPSKLQIKGLVNKNNAQQANDMLMKLDYLRSVDGKIIFGTGTPITNTVSEIYNMTRMVRPDILENAGIHSLDEWVNTFAKVESNFEIDIDGTIKSKPTKSIRSFVNGTELVAMFRQFADIVFTQDVVKDLPKANHHSIELEGTKEHKLINKMVNTALTSASGSEKIAVYGSMSGMLSASAVDLRMLSGVEKDGNPLADYSLEELDYENSKVNTMCGYIMKHYNDSKDIKGTQIVFCDGGAGSGKTYTFNVHKDIKEKLVKLGIPENEIVIIKDQNDSKLDELYAQVNSGEVRVLIGTSAKMAEGLNVQERIVAIHHPTVSYKPSDLEQGDARGVRKGNINSEVHIYRYLQGDTADSHKWQAIDRKGEMIRNALKGEDVGELEDIGADDEDGADIDPATAMAITSGNPLIKAKIDIDKKVNTLLTIKKNYQSEIYNYQDIIAKNPTHIATLEKQVAKIKEDIALRDKYGDNTKIVIKGKEYQKQGEANKALLEAVKTTAKNGTYIKIGEYNGFDVLFKGETGGLGYALLLKGAYEYSVDYNAQGNTMARFAGVLNRLDRDVENRQNQIDRMAKDLETAKQEVNKPFERESELNEALTEQKQITYDYEHYDEVKAKYEGVKATEDSDDEVSDDNSYDQASVNDRWKTENVEHNKKKKADVSLGGIVKKIRTKFGVPISTGKVPHKDARGVYKRKAETIRTRIANNLPTIAHELGHHLDKMYSLSGNKSVASLMKALPQDFLSLYPTKEQGKEAVAEFVRTYLKSITEAQKLGAEFYNDFVMTLSKEDLEALNEIASDFNYYLSMEIEEKYKSAIVNSKPTLKEKAKDIREGGVEGVKDSVEDKAHDSYTKWIDAFDPIKQAVDFVEKSTEKNLDGTHSAYVLATNSLNATTIASYLVNDGFRDLKGNILEEMSFKECIKGVKAKDLNTLSEYLVLKHSLELIEQDMRVFADDTLEDVDTINANIAKIEREHPEMIEASENLYQYQKNMLKYYLVDSGLLSVEGFNAMVEKYPCYVPFYRDVSSKKQGRARGTFANQSTPIKRIKGSGASIINPLESIVMNTEKFVKSATRNQVMQVLTSYTNEAEGFGQFMEKVTPDMLPHLIDITKYKEQFTERLQQTVNAVDYFNVTNLLDEVINDTVMDFTPKANASKKLVTVMRNGKASYYQIHDNALYSAIAEMTVPQLEGALKMISKIMLPMKTLMTQMNPLFASSNFFRDYGTAYKHSQINNPVEFAIRYMGALKSIITNGEMYQQYKAMGGGHSSKLATDINLIKKSLRDIEVKDKGKARQMAYAIFRHPLETITALNDIVESVPRVLEFTKTLIETGDYQQAIFNADDITTNFKRHGSGTTAKAVNQLVFFNNASLQGLDKTRRSLTGKDAVSKWTKWALFALLSSALQYFWNRREDEEGYEQLSSYTKNNFYNYAIGDGKFIAIPKPRETAIFDSLTERTIEFVFGNKEAFYDFGGYLADNLLPPMVAEDLFVGDIVNATHDFFGGTVVGGITDIGYNKDFMGRPIESNYEQDYLESWERYDEGTSKPAYYLGQTEWARNTNMSPKKIDHLLASSLGIIGSAIQAVFPMEETRKDVTLGLRNRFIKDSVYSTDVINKLWDNTEKAEAQFKYDSTIENALEYEQNVIITNFVSQMYNSIYSLPLEEQREAKKLLLKELNRWDYELTTAQQQMKTSLGDRGIDVNILLDSLPKSLYEWTENKQKYSYQMTPEEYVSFTKNYLKEIEKYRLWCKKTYTDQDEYIDNLTKANGVVMKYMRPYYNKQFKSKATKN